MRRFLIAVLLCFAFAYTCWAQSYDPNAPASKEDVEKYMQVVHSRKLVQDTLDAMVKPMHQMIHEQYLKDKDKLPPDFEDRMNSIIDNMLEQMPIDEMLNSTIPVYQKHFTKGDIAALVTFYSSPSGQKLLKEMPAIMSETMLNMMPIMRNYISKMNANVQTQIAGMKKQAPIPDSLKDSPSN